MHWINSSRCDTTPRIKDTMFSGIQNRTLLSRSICFEMTSQVTNTRLGSSSSQLTQYRLIGSKRVRWTPYQCVTRQMMHILIKCRQKRWLGDKWPLVARSYKDTERSHYPRWSVKKNSAMHVHATKNSASYILKVLWKLVDFPRSIALTFSCRK
jgi:hypothetical protein